MKKYLYLIPVAALAMTACTNESDEFVGSPESREISFMPVNQNATRAAVEGTDFPTTLDMMVTAYQVEATGGSAGVYFDATPFKYQYAGGSASGAGSYWGGDPARYWPLTAAYINFLAIANANADNATGVTWGTDKADQVTIAMDDNSTAQRDLMYARGDAAVTQSVNTLTFPSKVDMVFKHAQSLIAFRVKAADDASEAVHVDKITLNNAYYAGTFTVTHTGYNAKTSQSVDGVWTSPDSKKNLDVPGSTDKSIADDSWTNAGSVMVVPNPTQSTPPATDPSFDSFTITYTFDSKTYTYTYIPETPSNRVLTKATKYIYDITFKLHEIFINPSVTPWADGGTDAITIQN